jgi:predicted kinase
MTRGQEQLLFMRTGTFGSLPEAFNDSLAQEYEAELIIPADYRAELAPTWPSGRSAQAKLRYAVNERADRAVARSLAEGYDVVFGGYLNLSGRREAVRDIAAQVGGVRVVSLVVETSPEVIRQRIENHVKYVNGELMVSPHHQEAIAKKILLSEEMASRIDWPEQQEDPLQLNGDLEVSDLLQTIARHL